MELIGHIEVGDGLVEIDEGRWVALIREHPALAPIPPRQGINPFTKEPCEFKAPASTASVMVDGSRRGSICRAEDGSPVLLVDADESDLDAVAEIAREIAQDLGGHFLATPA